MNWLARFSIRSSLIQPCLRLLLILFILLMGGAAGGVLAQGNILTYGTTVVGTLAADTPLGFYMFNGTVGDHVTAYAVGITPGMVPALSLLGVNQRQLAVSDGDPLLGASGAARISYRLPDTGLYTLMVSNTGGAPGEFLLHLGARPAAASLNLALNVPAAINVPPGAAPIQYSFDANPASPLTLQILSTVPGFLFNAQVYNGMGQLVGLLGGPGLQGSSLFIGPDTGLYEVVVSGWAPEMAGALTLLLAPGSAAAPAGAALTPTPTEAAQPLVCQVRTAGGSNVNIRSGPTTGFPIIGMLTPASSLEVIGQSVDGTWYVVNMAGQRGWISGAVTRLEGPCTGLVFFESPPTPTPLPSTPTPTPPPGAIIDFTVNGTGAITVGPGGCGTVAWYTENVREVYYQGVGVSGVGSREECPTETTTYTLRVVLQDGSVTERYVTINRLLIIITLPPIITLPFPLPPGP